MKLVQTFPPLNYIKRIFFNKLQQRWCKDPFIFIIVLISLLRGCFRHKSRWLAALAGLLPPGDDDTRDGRLMDSIKMAPVCPHHTPHHSSHSSLICNITATSIVLMTGPTVRRSHETLDSTSQHSIANGGDQPQCDHVESPAVTEEVIVLLAQFISINLTWCFNFGRTCRQGAH